ncbi:octapeptide-repeat protein T2-like [Ambystoma mexicanum]|uniref:octapeptide-repeat protein T2-like n=1 Tax=Ambystoma mexicanum TaxID=8296 RepID=UPI0037E9931E
MRKAAEDGPEQAAGSGVLEVSSRWEQTKPKSNVEEEPEKRQRHWKGNQRTPPPENRELKRLGRETQPGEKQQEAGAEKGAAAGKERRKSKERSERRKKAGQREERIERVRRPGEEADQRLEKWAERPKQEN